MPELPEVITTINYIYPYIINKKIKDIWFDKKTKIENLTNKSMSQLKNKCITDIYNIGKYILFNIGSELTLIIHQKLSGHLLFSKFKIDQTTWKSPETNSPINDPNNRFIRFALKFNNQWLALSDSRRLARITLTNTKNIQKIKPINQMGINPLSNNWKYDLFKQKLKTHSIEIKKALLSQNIISGLGNIYSDEVLFKSKIKPTRKIPTLSEKELKQLFKYIPLILTKAIKNKGTTFNTYRNPDGNSGKFINYLNVYQRKNKNCKICNNKIESIKINGRTSYFCNHCQK